MTCSEFRRDLPDIVEGTHNTEQEAHLKLCSECSTIASDLVFISQQARLLRATEEPNQRLWNSLEIALRQEGLIREPQQGLSLVSPPSRRWSLAWLVPATAMFLVAFGVLMYYRGPSSQQQAANPANSAVVVAVNQPTTSPEDEQLLEAIESRTPTMRAAYEANLRDVNAYIRDAEESAKSNPGDEEAQQSLMEAYAQRNMVYEMALDRSLR